MSNHHQETVPVPAQADITTLPLKKRQLLNNDGAEPSEANKGRLRKSSLEMTEVNDGNKKLQQYTDRRYPAIGYPGEVRCVATTTRGRECAYVAVCGMKYCNLHKDFDQTGGRRRRKRKVPPEQTSTTTSDPINNPGFVKVTGEGSDTKRANDLDIIAPALSEWGAGPELVVPIVPAIPQETLIFQQSLLGGIEAAVNATASLKAAEKKQMDEKKKYF